MNIISAIKEIRAGKTRPLKIAHWYQNGREFASFNPEEDEGWMRYAIARDWMWTHHPWIDKFLTGTGFY